MATKKKKPIPGSIASRKEEIRAPRKKRNRFNPLQESIDKPLSKSFKEAAGVAGTVGGLGKFTKLTKIEQALRGIGKPTAKVVKEIAKAKKKLNRPAGSKKAAEAREKARAIKLAKKDPKEGALRRGDLEFERRARKSLEGVQTKIKPSTVKKRVGQLKLKASRKAKGSPKPLSDSQRKAIELRPKKIKVARSPKKETGQALENRKLGEEQVRRFNKEAKPRKTIPVAPVPKGKLKKVPSFKAKRSKSGKSTRAKR